METILTETVQYLEINPGETPESDPGDRTRAGSAPTGARYQLGYEPVLEFGQFSLFLQIGLIPL
jgi:hypothetical protein